MSSKKKLLNWHKTANISYFPHYAGVWTSFNSWYNEFYYEKHHKNPSSDRSAINYIKELDKRFKIVKAFWKLCDRKRDVLNPLLSSISNSSDELVYGYALYTLDNVITRFIQFAWTNPTVKNRIWCGNRNDKPTISHSSSKSIATMHISQLTYRAAYSSLRQFLASSTGIVLDEKSVQTVLEEFGIKSIGNILYMDPKLKPKTRKSPYARHLMPFIQQNFGQLLRAQTFAKGLFADVIELLYLVRNITAHGCFSDPSMTENNDVLQASYECLHTLILEFLDKPTTKLHP